MILQNKQSSLEALRILTFAPMRGSIGRFELETLFPTS